MSIFLSRRRGAGAIIGAAFVLLIIMSGYSLYAFQANTQHSSQAVYATMTARDQEKSGESVAFNALEKYPSNRLKINMTNSSPLSIHVIYLGLFDRSVSPEDQSYTPVSIYISPGETYVTNDAVPIPMTSSTNFMVQLVTERGNLFNVMYPFSGVGGSTTIIQNIATTTVTNFYTAVAGEITLDYKSIERAYRRSTQTSGFTFSSSWIVSDGEYTVWRMKITNNGATPFAVDSLTHLRFTRAGGSSELFFIVANTGTDASPVISRYVSPNTVTIPSGSSMILYFTVDRVGGNPASGGDAQRITVTDQFTGFLLLYDSTQQYAQTIPYIAIDVR
jgi:hypothetical protein